MAAKISTETIILNGQTVTLVDSRLYINGELYQTTGSSTPSNVVSTTGNQSISGQKTFLNNFQIGPDSAKLLKADFNSNTVDFYVDNISIFSSAGQLSDYEGNESLNWISKGLFDDSAVSSLDWSNRILKDNAPGASLDWQGRTLNGADGNPVFYWGDNKSLTGNWKTNTNPTDYFHIANKGYVDAQFADVLRTTGEQTIDGVKTFNTLFKAVQIYDPSELWYVDLEAGSLYGPSAWTTYSNPSSDFGVVNKGYLEDRSVVFFKSSKVNLKTTGSYSLSVAKSNYWFHVDSWEIVVTDFSGIVAVTGSGMPVVSFGDSQTNNSGFMQNVMCSGSGKGARVIFDSPQNGTTGNLGFRVAIPASGATNSYMSGVCIYKGYFITH